MGVIGFPSTPPEALISSMASNVPERCSCSVTEVTPLPENKTPTRQVFSKTVTELTF